MKIFFKNVLGLNDYFYGVVKKKRERERFYFVYKVGCGWWVGFKCKVCVRNL